MTLWNFEIGDKLFCVWPSIKWIPKEGWLEIKEGYHIVTEINGDMVKTDRCKKWAPKTAFTKVPKIEIKENITNEVLVLEPTPIIYNKNERFYVISNLMHDKNKNIHRKKYGSF